VPAPTPPTPTKIVGGHIGVALPLVTVSKETKSIGDQFTILNPIGIGFGIRLAFQVNALANVGLIPLVNYGLVDFDGGTWFIEAAFPTFYQDREVAFNVVAHTGVAF